MIIPSVVYLLRRDRPGLIKPKDGILDPQGKAVERALPTLGVRSVSDVRVGRIVELHSRTAPRLEGLARAARQPADRGLRDR